MVLSLFIHSKGQESWIHGSEALPTCKQKIESNRKLGGPGNEAKLMTMGMGM